MIKTDDSPSLSLSFLPLLQMLHTFSIYPTPSYTYMNNFPYLFLFNRKIQSNYWYTKKSNEYVIGLFYFAKITLLIIQTNWNCGNDNIFSCKKYGADTKSRLVV